METSFLSFTTRRYLRGVSGRQEGSQFLRFISIIAVGGIALGVAALLLALSIVRGFSSEIEAKIVGFGAHIQIENLQDAPVENGDEIVTAIKEHFSEVVSIQSYVEEFGLLRAGRNSIEGIRISGTERIPPFIENNIVEGSANLSLNSDKQSIVVGRKLTESLGLKLGDTVTVFSIQGDSRSTSSPAFTRPKVKQFQLTGIYETSLADYDEIIAFTNIEVARNLFKYADGAVSRIDVSITNTDNVVRIADEIEDLIGFPLMARTIYDVFQSIFAWVRLQESIIPIVISVIVIVAAFNVVGTMLMILLEKTSDVGILMSIGASPRAVRRLFTLVGLGLGMIGTVIGSVLALVFAVVQKRFGIIPLPAESYYMDTAPIELAATDFVIVAVVTLTLCMMAAYIPARVASRVQPVSVIRFH